MTAAPWCRRQSPAAGSDARHGEHGEVAARLASRRLRLGESTDAADETGDALREVFTELLRDRATAHRLATLIEG